MAEARGGGASEVSEREEAELLATLARKTAELTGPGGAYELVTTTVDGVSFEVFDGAPANLRELYRSGLDHGEADFYVYDDERYSFQDAWGEAARVANALLARGLTPAIASALRCGITRNGCWRSWASRPPVALPSP